MNKSDLIDYIASTAELSKRDAGKAVDAVFEGIIRHLAQGDTVAFVGFGTFKVSERAEREGRNPRTGDTIKIPKVKVPKFKPGKQMKDSINQA